jgi:hypothetical protein
MCQLAADEAASLDNVRAVALKRPFLLALEKVTLPVGTLAGPVSVSDTVTVQLAGWPTSTGEGVQDTVLFVVRGPTWTLPVPMLDWWGMSPP